MNKVIKIKKKITPAKAKKLPEIRTCKYFLEHVGVVECLGTTIVPMGKDMDDAFPLFHRKNFSKEHYKFLEFQINSGAMLRAESDFSDEKYALTYVLKDDPGLWIGRQSTLEYFGVKFTPVS